uniref:FAD-dependent oxidoreductase n=1 Tax=Phenylobacterium sp. TaxID=1871053 RepID=UPI003983BEC1
GMPAAIFAADRGARVLILEAEAEIGGSLWVSTGQMSAAGSRVQKDKGIEDTPDEHYDDIMRISRGTANPGIVRLAVDNAADTFDWLCDLGLVVEPHHPITGWGHEHYSKRRYYWAPEGGLSIKAVLTPQVDKRVAEGRIAVRVQHKVVELLTQDGGVTGVVAQDADGGRHAFSARKVALTSGGYGANPQMFEALSGVPQYSAAAYRGSQGVGHRLGEAVGGVLRGAEHYFIGFGSVLEGHVYPAPTVARLITAPERRQPWEIYVNVLGERFVREDIPSVDARENALFVQPDKRYWVIFDQAILDAAPPMVDDWSRDEVAAAFDGSRTSFIKADTLTALAAAAGIDADGLARSVEGYNYGVQTGHDFFGRAHRPLPISRTPFYAIRQQGATVTSAVGLAVNDGLQVVRADGSAIPNLFAAGEILGSSQTMGRSACGGMMVTPAMTFGRLLGQTIIPLE